MMRSTLLNLLIAAALMGTGIQNDAAAQVGKTVFLVRHAEKAAEPRGNPPLTLEGHKRAQALAGVLADAHIDHIITSQFLRTVDTAAYVALNQNLEGEIVAVSGSVEAHVKAVADAVRARPDGEAILVVGHSNTIPAIVGELGGSVLSDLADDEYSTLFIVLLSPDREPRTIRATYGAPSGTAR